MSLCIVDGLSLSFGPKTIVDNAQFTIGPFDKVGLVGANGTGKSTLLKMLSGQLKADSGRITFRKQSRVGYLPQDLSVLPQGQLLESVLRAVPGKDALDERLSSTEALLMQSTDADEQLELAGLLSTLHEEKEQFDAHYGPHRAEQILAGLGFRSDDMHKDTTAFSGGWRMRAALASLLLQDPDLLLLDEPTNHLDLPTLAWFDAFLKRGKKALMLISHDREFLNRHITKVLSLEMEGLRLWAGNHDDYRRLRALEYERLLATSQKESARRAELEAFVNRFRAKASKAKQAQSKLKQLQKMEVTQVTQERDTVSFRFPETTASGKEVAQFAGVKKVYGAKTVYDNVNIAMQRGERIAVVGLNGAGKTTLLKLLAEEVLPDSGKVSLGHNVNLGYYAQHHTENLDPSATILEEMQALVPDKPQSHVRSVLGAFLFSKDDVDKPIGVLSGGEKARVALAKLLLKPANLLVMDEPTNHLDLDSSEALIDALGDYQGTLIFVSHNRSFVDALATKVWDVRKNDVVPYPGNLSEYLYHLDQSVAENEGVSELSVGSAPNAAKERKRQEAAARQEKSARLKPLRKQLSGLELDIAKIEREQKEREAMLAQEGFAADYAKARPMMEEHRDAAARLEGLYASWEHCSTEIAQLEGVG